MVWNFDGNCFIALNNENAYLKRTIYGVKHKVSFDEKPQLFQLKKMDLLYLDLLLESIEVMK